MPKANAVYDKIGIFLKDILQDNSIASLINLAKPSTLSNVIMEKPEQRIQIKPNGSGYFLTYKTNKLSIIPLDNPQLVVIRDTLQSTIDQRIAAQGIHGLCSRKENTFLHIMGNPSDCQTYIIICLDYDEENLTAVRAEAPVYAVSSDIDYGC